MTYLKTREYGYCRTSKPTQNLERQERNIKAAYPNAIIVREQYTGTKLDRPEWNKLYKYVSSGDTIIFDSVSRMSRNAEEGFAVYQELYNRGVRLVFLKEPTIDTSVYHEASQGTIPMTGTDADCILQAVNKYMMILAERQIRIAFDQAQKEVDDLRQRTREGIETARLAGKQIGAVQGKKLTTKKSIECKAIIEKHCRDFGGTLRDKDVIKLCGISRGTFYAYKRQLKAGE